MAAPGVQSARKHRFVTKIVSTSKGVEYAIEQAHNESLAKDIPDMAQAFLYYHMATHKEGAL